MKFTKLICVLLAVFTVLALASCGGKENDGAGTSSGEGTTPAVTTTPEVTTDPDNTSDTEPTPPASSSESDTEPVTPPASSSEEDTEPIGPADDYVIPADGKITLGDGANGISYPFAAGVLTGLTGDNYAVSVMSNLNKINWFTKVVNPIGGFGGNWQLTEDSTLNQFTAGNYGDIQMFYHTNESNWVFGPSCSKGQAIVIKFTAPADGNYTYTVSGRDWAATSGGAVMDVHIGENMHNWWDMFRYAGNQHGAYAAQQVSSVKALTAGTNVYFIIRTAGGMDTVTAISDFTITYTPAA